MMREFISYGKNLWDVAKSFDESGSHVPKAFVLLIFLTAILVCVAFSLLLVRMVIALANLIAQ